MEKPIVESHSQSSREQKCWRMVKRHYHDKGWEHAYRKYESLLADALEEGATVLDVGCGRHFPMADFFLAHGAEPHGIDPVADETDVGRPRITIKRAMADHIPYDDNTFDVIASRSVIEHLEDPGAVFVEFNRVLKPDGRVVFLTPSKYDYVSIFAAMIPNSLHGRIVKYFEGRDEGDTFSTFYRANSVRQIRRLAKRTGFSVDRITYHNHYPSMFMRYPILCRATIAYDRLISSWAFLHWLQGSVLGILRSEGGTLPTRTTSDGESCPAGRGEGAQK